MSLAERTCPECGANILAGRKSCWLCSVDLTRPSPGTPAGPPPVKLPPLGTSLSSWMLLVLLGAVLFGAFAIAPGLGIALAFLAAPALLRATFVSQRWRSRGEHSPYWVKVAAFFSGLFVVLALLVALGSALAAVCFATVGLKELGPGAMIGVAVALLLFISCITLVVVTFRRWRREGARP